MAEKKKSRIWDCSLDMEARLDALLSELTLEEKTLLCGTGAPGIERLSIPEYTTGGEAAHGVEARHDQSFNKGVAVKTTCFPQPFGMSMMWDPELMEEIGTVVGTEARILAKRECAKGKKLSGLCRWAPTVDMERDPRWGRTEEGYGEDPYLTGKTAAAYIRGMRGSDAQYIRCGATLKHFYANNTERDRVSASSSISLRDKFEYYMEPFRRCIEEGGAEAVMTAYNEINGVPAICNPDVQKLLKDTYHLRGHVVCDGGDMVQTVQYHHYFDSHAETVAAALKAGVDEFTDSAGIVVPAIREALDRELIAEQDLDRAIRNSFRTRIRLGQFDPPEENPYSDPDESLLCSEAHAKIAARAAQEAVTLLQNRDGYLPFVPKKGEKIAVIGPLADEWYKDWYCGIPPYETTVLDGMKKECPDSEIIWTDGLDRGMIRVENLYVSVNEETGEVYLTDFAHASVFIRNDWGDGGVTFREATSGRFLTAVDEKERICLGKTEAFAWFIKEAFHIAGSTWTSWCGQPLFVKNGQLCAHMRPEDMAVTGGQEDTLSGLSRSREDVSPAKLSFEVLENGSETAVTLAKSADRVVLCLGSDPVINAKEEIDRNHLHLPHLQEKLLEKISEVQPDTVLVLISNYPYILPKAAERIGAIIFSASGCQEYGNAVAKVLTGKVNPAGRLSMTWVSEEAVLADMTSYDLLEGKRTYRYREDAVRYPFGYGLSYSDFCYESMEVSCVEQELRFLVRVTNTSLTDGDEVVQLYYRKEVSAVKRPRRQLIGFRRVRIAAAETVSVEFTVPKEDLMYYDVLEERMLLERGEYCFMAGPDSENLSVSQTLSLEGGLRGSRRLEDWYPADHYDEQKGTYLYRGYETETSVFAREVKKQPEFSEEVKERQRPAERDKEQPELYHETGQLRYDNCRYCGKKAQRYALERKRITKDVRTGMRKYADKWEDRVALTDEAVLAAIADDREFTLVLEVEGSEGITAFRIIPLTT